MDNDAVTCAENISFLYLLHSVADPPSKNELKAQQKSAQRYILSFKEENQLVQSLAFLANDSDDVNHIPALAIEQRAPWLDILLAVNRIRPLDGTQSSKRLQGGFNTIFRSLANIEQLTEDDVFSAIISMCTKRILIRLRLSRVMRHGQKQKIQDALRCVIKCLSKTGMGSLNELSRLFIEKAKIVVRLAENWFKHQTQMRLEELVDSIYHLKQADVDVVLRDLEHRNMDPSIQKNVFNIVGKISRYREIARYLSRRSKKNVLFRNMRISIINLPSQAYDRPPKAITSCSAQQVLTRVQHSFKKADIIHLRRLINISDTQLTDQVTKTLSQSKVHAEVQIIYYLELAPSILPPRIIASSKNACFLCNVFIEMHGKFHTPGTHGRIYPGWRLPNILYHMNFGKRFNRAIVKRINRSLKELLKRRQTTSYPDPAESVLGSLSYCASTIFSVELARCNAKEAIAHGEGVTTSISSETKTKQSEEKANDHCQNMPLASIAQKDPSNCVSYSEVVSDAALNTSFEPEHRYNSMIEVSKGLNVVLDRTTTFLRADQVHLYVEYEGEVTGIDTLYWLNDLEARKAQEQKTATILDMEQLSDEITIDCNGDGCIFIVTGRVVVQMTRSGGTA